MRRSKASILLLDDGHHGAWKRDAMVEDSIERPRVMVGEADRRKKVVWFQARIRRQTDNNSVESQAHSTTDRHFVEITSALDDGQTIL
jgi:hypothetical protein